MEEERTYLCTINDVYFALVYISDVTSPQPTVLINGCCSSGRVVEVAIHHTWAFDVHLAVHFILLDCIPVQIL